MIDPLATFADLAALIAAHGIAPISVYWTDNPATGHRRWSISVPTCGDFDRLAAVLPTPADRRWLNGDRHDPFTGRTSRSHATADGELIHLCRCTHEQKEALL